MNGNRFFKLRPMVLPALLFFGVILGGIFFVRSLERIGQEHLQEQGVSALGAMAQGIENELGASHAVVKAMSGSPWILPAVLDPSPVNIERAYSVLSRYNESLGFSVCYLLDTRGTAIISSNRDTPESFVGKNYAFRPYFQEAMAGKTAFYMAAGVTSHERGAYAAHPVRDTSGRIVGVAAIKKNVDAVRGILAAYPHSFLINSDGVVFMAGVTDMVFRSLWPVPPARAHALKASRQFGVETFDPVFDSPVQQGDVLRFQGESYQCFRNPIVVPGWSLVLLMSRQEVDYFRTLGWGVTGAVSLMLVLVFIWMLLRLKAAETLRESQERFRAAFESSAIGMAIVRMGGQWLQVNGSLCRILGYSEKELFGMTWQQITHPEDLESDLARARRLVAGEVNEYSMEKRFIHKDGHQVWVLLTVALVRDSRGAPLYFISQFEDITRRKEDEKKLEQKIGELERFNRIAVGRELEMIELKKKLKVLEKGAGAS